MNLKELDSFSLSDAISFHDELNPNLWDGQALQPEVKEQLLIIAKDFLEELGVNDLDVKDITVSGSNAAYSYTPHSDLDLHILVDLSKLDNNEIYRELFNAKKTIYNDTHNITIHGVPVELYVQDAREPVVSLGEYSILKDKWLRIPTKRRANLDQTATKQKYTKLSDIINRTLKSKNILQVNKIIQKIKQYRQAGLDKGGEFGPENLAYKILRKQELISKLYNLRDKLHSEELTIEDYDPNGPPPGPEFKPTMPKGTVRVDVSDVYDWYKLGQHISNMKGLGKHDFGKGPPSTILSFGDEDLEHKYIQALQKTGLTTTDIDPVDPKQPKGMKRQKVDPTYNVVENFADDGTTQIQFNHSISYDYNDDPERIAVTANKNGQQIGYAEFVTDDPSYGVFYSEFTKVEPEYQKQGIGRGMYNYAKKLKQIKQIVPSPNQSGAGASLWKHKDSVWENFSDSKNPQDKGDSKRYKVPTKGKISTLRKVAEQDMTEGFDQPYPLKWEKSDYGDVDALATLADGTYLSIMFNKQQDNEGEEVVEVEFYRNNSQEVTGEGDAMRIFATVLTAIQQYVKKYKPARLTFSARKEVEQDQNTESRAKLYDRLVQRYSNAWGYRALRADNEDLVIYELSRLTSVKEEVNPKIFNDIINSLPMFGTKPVQIGDFMFDARTFIGGLGDPDAKGLQIRSYDPKKPKGQQTIGSASFTVKTDKKGNSWLESDDTKVDDEYRGKGVAALMYAYAKSLGNDIKPSPYQSEKGRAMWKKWGKDAEHLMREASGYIPSEKEKNDPRFKTALTVDVHPDTMKKNAKKFGNKISRAGIPPTARPDGKF